MSQNSRAVGAPNDALPHARDRHPLVNPTLLGFVETHFSQLRMRGRECPRHFKRNAEHRGDGVISKRDKGALVLPRKTQDVYVALNDGVGVSAFRHVAYLDFLRFVILSIL